MNSMILSQILIIEKDGLVAFDIFFIILFALAISSFLNVLIYRLPLNISLINPKRSRCTSCEEVIPWYHNIPILSYLLLRGKCSNCKSSISLQYPIIEILSTCITFILFQQLGLSYEFYFITLIVYILIVLSYIDIRYKAVPTILLIVLTSITILYLFLFKKENISIFFMFAGAIVIIELFVTYYIQNIKSKITQNDLLKEQKAIGEGDIPIIALLGGLLGLKFGIVAIFLSAILAIIPSVLNIVLKKETETPFIPFLSLGFIITYTNENNIQKILEGLNIL